MVPDAFHDYFVASAGVAGALIGLLFVAISVHPEQVGEGSDSSQSYRPSAALSALLNPLLISLLMLIPEVQVGGAVVAVGLIGLVAVLSLLVGLVPQRRRMGWRHLVRAVVLLVGQGWVYATEVQQGLRLRSGGDGHDEAATLCFLVIILFAIGIERAWEFVGARMPGVWSILATVWRRHERP